MVLDITTKLNIYCSKKIIQYIIGIIVGLSFISLIIQPCIKTELINFLESLQSYGYFSLPFIFILYVICNSPTFLPTNVLHVTCGFIFGIIKGFLFAIIMYTISATIPFLITRKCFMEKAKQTLETTKWYSLITIIEEKPLMILLCCRISPLVPGSMENILFGITNISISSYMFGTFLGISPQLIIFVYFGTIFQNISEISELNLFDNVYNLILFITGLVLTCIMMIIITIKANKIINQNILP